MKLRTRKLAVFATCLGIGAAFPVLSSADNGGVPHNLTQHPCPGKGKRHHKKPAPNNKGKKCGFAPGSTTSTAAPSLTSGTGTDTTTTTSSTISSTTP